MDIEKFTATQQKALEALAVYRYLTVKQMLQLAVSKDKSHLYKALGDLEGRQKEIIKKFDYAPDPKKGPRSAIYVLTEYGVELAAEAMGQDLTPISNPRQFSLDYEHRVGCVDFHIYVRQWAEQHEAEVDFYHTYYDPWTKVGKGERSHPVTRIKYDDRSLDADAVFSLTDRAGVTRLFAFEMYNGRKTNWVSNKLLPYVPALDADAFKVAYGYNQAVRILIVFNDQRGMELVCKRVIERNMIERRSNHFYMNTLASTKTDLIRDWQRFDGEETRLF